MASLGILELVFILLYILFGWIIGPLLVGRYAENKGMSFPLFFLISFVATPILGFIAALIVPNPTSSVSSISESSPTPELE